MLSMANIVDDNTVISSIKKKNKFCKINENVVNEIFSNIINDLTNRYGDDNISITTNNICVELFDDTDIVDMIDFIKAHFTEEYESMFTHVCKITMIKGKNKNVFNIERKK